MLDIVDTTSEGGEDKCELVGLNTEDEEDEARQRSFGEKLRQTRDDEDDSGKSEDEPKLSLTEQEGKIHLLFTTIKDD